MLSGASPEAKSIGFSSISFFCFSVKTHNFHSVFAENAASVILNLFFRETCTPAAVPKKAGKTVFRIFFDGETLGTPVFRKIAFALSVFQARFPFREKMHAIFFSPRRPGRKNNGLPALQISPPKKRRGCRPEKNFGFATTEWAKKGGPTT